MHTKAAHWPFDDRPNEMHVVRHAHKQRPFDLDLAGGKMGDRQYRAINIIIEWCAMHTIVSIIMQSVRPICAACVRKTRAGAWKCARTPETHTHTRTQRQMKLKIRECDVSRFCERFGVFFVFDYTALCLRSLFICVPVARHVVPHKVIFCCCCIIAIDTYFVCVIVPTNHKSICEPQSGVCVCVPRLLIAALNSGPILYICIYGFVWYCLGRASMVWSTCVRQNAVAERFSSSKWTSRL